MAAIEEVSDVATGSTKFTAHEMPAMEKVATKAVREADGAP